MVSATSVMWAEVSLVESKQVLLEKFKSLGKRVLKGRYSSLNRLDKKLERYVNFDDGYFVELGANDGINQSNSLYFEKYRNWRGVLVEPAPHNFLKCRQNRAPRSRVYCAACVPFDYANEFVRIVYSNLMSTSVGLKSDIKDPRGHAQLGNRFLAKNEMIFEFGALAKTLNALLLEAGAPQQIDFLSLDVEGAELDVLRGVDHQAFRFRYILVECRDLERLSEYLERHGYSLVDKLSGQDYLFAEIDAFARRDDS
jgi:FkbM family methyltransferase